MPREMELRWLVQRTGRMRQKGPTPAMDVRKPVFGKPAVLRARPEDEEERTTSLQQFVDGKWRDVPITEIGYDQPRDS